MFGSCSVLPPPSRHFTELSVSGACVRAYRQGLAAFGTPSRVPVDADELMGMIQAEVSNVTLPKSACLWYTRYSRQLI